VSFAEVPLQSRIAAALEVKHSLMLFVFASTSVQGQYRLLKSTTSVIAFYK